MRKGVGLVIIVAAYILTACSGDGGDLSAGQSWETYSLEEMQTEENFSTESMPTGEQPVPETIIAEDISTAEVDTDNTQRAEPVMLEEDWSDFFGPLNGTAVIYDPAENCCQVYNRELALTRRSPCSTFKIISSLTAMENGIIDPEDSTRTWSGETFWNAEWNRDVDFQDAFRSSCVWYFREVINEIGREAMQEELDKLQYGNCDISDWEGLQNTNNSNPSLTGFWLESSLLISPVEQTAVMERIFGGQTDYSEETVSRLRQVMLLSEQKEADISVYGKTGMGKSQGTVVDAWYTGFADRGDRRLYFCVYLGETDSQEVSSARAREIALKILSQN